MGNIFDKMAEAGVKKNIFDRMAEADGEYIPAGPSPSGDPFSEPPPFDLDGKIAEFDPEGKTNPRDLASVIMPFAQPFLSTGYTTAAALNRGMATLSAHFDIMADYASERLQAGAKKGGLFEKAAKQYNENTEYWQQRSSQVGVSFLEELFGEAVGGAIPGITEFILNIPYSALLGAAQAHKQGKSEIAGALVEAAKRGVLGAVFHAMGPMKQYLRAPAMGSVFALQTASEGGSEREIAKGFGTGMIYSSMSPGGRMGLNEISRDLQKQIVLDRAKEDQATAWGPRISATAPGDNSRPDQEASTKFPPLSQAPLRQTLDAKPPSGVSEALTTLPSNRKYSGYDSAIDGTPFTENISISAAEVKRNAEIDELVGKAETALPVLEKALSEIAEPMNGTVDLRIKERKRIDEKIEQRQWDDPDFGPDGITDYLGSRIIVQDPERSIAEIVKGLQERGVDLALRTDGAVSEPHDMIYEPNKWGYRAIHLDVRTPDGHIGEVQVHFPEGAEVVGKSHALYEKWRTVMANNKGEIPPEMKAEFSRDQETSKGWWEEATRRYRERQAGAEADVRPSAVTSVVDTKTSPVRRVNTSDIAVDPDRFQFKMDVDNEGVQKSLEGDWNDLAAGNLLLWQAKDDKLYVANGHHRLAYAKRNGVDQVNAQVIREADGYGANDARRLAAEANILEGKGTIYDQAEFFRLQPETYTPDVARQRGIAGRGYTIGQAATDSTYSSFRLREISPEAAEAITKSAPRDEALQAAGVRYAVSHPKSEPYEISSFINALSTADRVKTEQGDLFGYDDSAIRTAEVLSKTASQIIREIREKINSVRGAANRPETAKALGVNVRNPEAVKQAVVNLYKELYAWEKWHLDPTLSAIVRQRAGLAAAGGSGAGSIAMSPQAGFRREPSSVGEASDPLTRRSDLVRFLTEKLDIPIRTGRFLERAIGIFKPKSEVIRTLNANDIEVISHEIGHALQKFLFPESLKSEGLTSQPFAAFSGELEPMATKPKPGQDVVPEGFAEFVRLYITNPNKALEKAPSFYKHFEHLLDERSPESKDILLAARDHYEKFLKQPALKRVLSQISVGETGDRKSTLHDLYTATVDDLHPLKQIVDEMSGAGKPKAAQDPYRLARLFRGWHGKVDAFLRNSPFEFKTYRDVGKPLHEILEPIKDRLDEFRAYVVSRRTLELAGREKPVETGVLEADARAVIDKYDADFSQTFKDLKEYQDHCLNYLRDSGVIGEEAYAKIKELNDDYVPLYRVMEATEGKGIGQGFEARNPVKKIKGSWRDIQDPLESIIKNTYVYINMAERNAVGEALINLAEKNEGMGKFVEKIPVPMKAVKITPEELAKFGLENLPEEAAVVFRPSAFTPQEKVITVFRDGKQELYQVHPDIARTFKALDKESVGLLEKILSYPASWLRAGATLTPEFISRNPLRDQFSAFLYSKYGYIPGVDLVRGVFALAGKKDAYWEWKKAGGDHSMLVSMDRAYMQDQLADVLRKYPVRNLIRNPIEGLRVLSELGEAGTRIGEFMKGLQKEGMSKEAIQEAGFASREVTLDFARKGAATKAMNIITAFWNAGIQGQDKMAREFINNPSGMAWKTALAITLPSVLLAVANHNDDRIKDIPQWQRDIFWLIPTDNAVYRIPKPFEIGIIFGSIPERITHFIMDKDPHSFDGLLKSLSRAGMPGLVPTAAIPIMENWANRSSFFDRPIVPQNRTDLLSEYQYGPYTSETAKAIGKGLGKLPWMDELPVASPAKIENLIQGWTGGLGRYAMNLSDLALETAGVVKPDYEKPEKTLADYPLIKAFVVRYPSASTENITRFYDDYETITKKLNSMKALQKEFRFDEAMKIMEAGDLMDVKGIHAAMKNVHSMIDDVTINPLIKANEKREFIDILYLQMTDLAKAGNEAIDAVRELEKQIKRDRENEILTPARRDTGFPIDKERAGSVVFMNESGSSPDARANEGTTPAGMPTF